MLNGLNHSREHVRYPFQGGLLHPAVCSESCVMDRNAYIFTFTTGGLFSFHGNELFGFMGST